MCIVLCENVNHWVASDSLQSMDHSPLGSSVHGILQTRILEWVVSPFSRGSSIQNLKRRFVCINTELFLLCIFLKKLKKKNNRDIMGRFLAKIGTIKDRNGMDLTEAEEMKKTWQEYTEEQYKKIFMTQIIMMVIIYLEPDILECEVKWALGSTTMNKATGCDGIPVELFQILKDDAVKVLHSIYQQIWKTLQWPQDWKRSVFIPIPKKGNAKNAQTTTQLHPFHRLASNAQNSPNQASTVCEPWISR